MGMGRHRGCPQLALKLIPRAAMTAIRARVWSKTLASTLRGASSPSSWSYSPTRSFQSSESPEELLRVSVGRVRRLHSNPSEDFHSNPNEGSHPKELRVSLLRNGGFGGFSSKLIGIGSFSYGGFIPGSFVFVRSFSHAHFPELQDHCKEGEGFQKVRLASASSGMEAGMRQVSDPKGNELESLQVELRARESENKKLRIMYDRVFEELQALKLVMANSNASQPATDVSSSDHEAAQVQQREIKHSSVADFVEAEDSASFVSSEKSRAGAGRLSLRGVDPLEDGYDHNNIGKVSPAKSQEARKAHDMKDDGSMFGSLKKKTAASSTSEPWEDHPWPEWTNFLNHLKAKNYFLASVDAAEDEEVEGTGRIKKAVMDFGRDRDDIFESFSKNDLKTLARFGCPSTDRKIVNAGKRLRAFLEISEASVCQPCTLKSTCARAFSECGPGSAGTVDVIRLLLQMALNVEEPLDAQLSLPPQVQHAVVILLKQAVEASKVPRDPNRPRLEPTELLTFSPVAKTRPAEPRSKLRAGNEQIEMKTGDWRCPECQYINFSRNRHCRECSAPRPPQEMRPGDWECLKCQYVNYAKNLECRDCHAERPRVSSTKSARGDRSFDGRQSSREHASGNRGRDDRRDFGDIPAGNTRYKHEDWKVNPNKQRRKFDDDDFDDDINDDESVDLDIDSELDDLELDEDDLDDDFDDLEESDEEIEYSKSRKAKNSRMSPEDFDDLDDFEEEIDYAKKRKKNSRSSHGDFDDLDDLDEEIDYGRKGKKKNSRGSLKNESEVEDDEADDVWDDLGGRSKGRGDNRGGRSSSSQHSRSSKSKLGGGRASAAPRGGNFGSRPTNSRGRGGRGRR